MQSINVVRMQSVCERDDAGSAECVLEREADRGRVASGLEPKVWFPRQETGEVLR